MVNKKKHIFIIGMMCSGKSSLAPILSQKLNIPFIDIHKEVFLKESNPLKLFPFEMPLQHYNVPLQQ